LRDVSALKSKDAKHRMNTSVERLFSLIDDLEEVKNDILDEH